MDSSGFEFNKLDLTVFEPLTQNGATCNAFRVKIYGKLHFLKRLKPAYAGDIRYQEALRKEFETGFRLEHPNLVRYISFDAEGILMEYVDGDTLSELLRRQPEYFCNNDNLIRFLSQLLDAVQYLHEHQVLHLDLKPENILLAHINHDVKLVDLGCCLTDTFTDTPGRTPYFAAPEQLNPSMPVDERTDLFAVGRILQFINGVTPLPPHVLSISKQCQSLSPDDRPSSAEAVRNALNQQVRRRRGLRRLRIAALITLLLVPATCYLCCRLEANTHFNSVPNHDTIHNQQTNKAIEALQTSNIDHSVLADTTSRRKGAKASSPKSSSNGKTMTFEQEAQEGINQAYKATIATFVDSIFPSPSAADAWETNSTEFYNQLNILCKKLENKYPDKEPETINTIVFEKFHALVGYVFNQMRLNGEASERKKADSTQNEKPTE